MGLPSCTFSSCRLSRAYTAIFLQELKDSSHLNTAQQVGSLPTEVEQALSLAWWYDKSGSIEQAILQTQASMPSAAYLEVIGEWVSNYGGGDKFPLIRYVESFAKQTGQGLMLGEDFVSQVVHTIYKCEKTTFPMMRISFFITQLSAPKTVPKRWLW